MKKLLLSALSPEGEHALKWLKGKNRGAGVAVISEDPLVISFEFKDLRVKLAVKAGLVDLENAACMVLYKEHPQLKRGVDYEVVLS